MEDGKKYCKHCAAVIDEDCIICPVCGKQVEILKQDSNPIIIQNSNTNVNTNANHGTQKNKWIALLLCFFLGGIGAHRFYEGKIFTGLLYLFTAGLFGFGWFIDFLILLFKPNPYYV